MSYDPDELYEETDIPTIERWLEACESAAEVPLLRGGTAFSDWEREFLESVRAQYDERIRQDRRKPLSGKQLVVLRKMYDKT